jgi:hypothetical protein
MINIHLLDHKHIQRDHHMIYNTNNLTVVNNLISQIKEGALMVEQVSGIEVWLIVGIKVKNSIKYNLLLLCFHNQMG